MIQKFARKLRSRMSRAVGLPNIYGRLDEIERSLTGVRTSIGKSDRKALDDLSASLQLLELRLKTYLEVVLHEQTNLSRAQLDDTTEGFRRELTDFVNLRIDEVSSAASNFITTRADEVQQTLRAERESQLDSLRSELKTYKELIFELRQSLADVKSEVWLRRSNDSVASATDPDEVIPDFLYERFENRFRGSWDEIRRRAQIYISRIPANATALTMLDVGCGRGEWLDVATGQGHKAIGIDLNISFVRQCNERNLKAVESEALLYLSEASDEAFDLISMFHVVEHLTYSHLFKVFVECHRALSPNGRLVLEFPNIRNPEVGASSFWLDPTHRRPLHPEFVEFLLREAGFSRISMDYPNYESDPPVWGGSPLSTRDVALTADR